MVAELLQNELYAGLQPEETVEIDEVIDAVLSVEWELLKDLVMLLTSSTGAVGRAKLSCSLPVKGAKRPKELVL